MNESLELVNKLYKPYKIVKKNKCYILYTMDKNICVKTNSDIDYPKLYTYLKTRKFDNLPSLIETERNNIIIYRYIEDIEMNNQEKAVNLIKTVASLHSKTAYYEEIKEDKYKEIYLSLQRRIKYINSYYSNIFDNEIKTEYISPSSYLLLNNYSLILNACRYSENKLESWWQNLEKKDKQRLCLIHNNLELDHYLKNDKDYLISWDNYTFDTPVVDLYKLYEKEWDNVPFKEIFEEYNKIFPLNNDEKVLLDILISIPYEIPNEKNELDRCRSIRKLINYLKKSSKIVISDQ